MNVETENNEETADWKDSTMTFFGDEVVEDVMDGMDRYIRLNLANRGFLRMVSMALTANPGILEFFFFRSKYRA